MIIQQHGLERLGWFSLPRELRDKVTIEILTQEEVRIPEVTITRRKHIHPKAIRHFITTSLPKAIFKYHEDEEEKLRLRTLAHDLHEMYEKSVTRVLGEAKPPLRKASGLQLLVTCKQAYTEGLEIFYSSNTFVLPPGPVEHSMEHFFTTFPVQYTQRIRHFVIELGLQDLTPEIFTECRQALKEFMAKDTSQIMIRSLPGGTVPLAAPYIGVLWGIFVKARLYKIWVQKLALSHPSVTQTNENCPLLKVPVLMTVRMNGHAATVDRAQVGDWGTWKPPLEMQQLLVLAREAIKTEIEEKVNQVGWRATKAWVDKGKWKSHVCG